MAAYYATVAQIESEFKDIHFTSSFNVTDDDVTDFITEADALIDAKIGTRYATPAPNASQGYLLLRRICRAIVSERVRGILEVKKVIYAEARLTVKSSEMTAKEANEMLDLIAAGSMALPGVAPIGGGITSNNTASTPRGPVFDKNRQQW